MFSKKPAKQKKKKKQPPVNQKINSIESEIIKVFFFLFLFYKNF